jgi:putative peptide zinc metalloprotease protein
MSDPAKLQLLTRSSDESGFDIFEIDSNQAYSGFKPQRLPETEWELMRQPLGADGTRHFVLKNLRKDRYLLLSAKECFLWEHFDGRNSLDEIGRAFHLEFGAFDYSLIRQFLTKLYNARLIEDHQARVPESDFVTPQTRSRIHLLRQLVNAWRRFAVRTHKADRYCSTLYRRGGFVLFHPLTLCAIVAIAIAALAAAYRLAAHSLYFARVLSAQPLLSASIILFTLLAASMLHVLVHALACKAHGRRVREMGFFLLQGVLPTFYADVTDIFMSNRRARLTVDLAGPMVEVSFGSVAILSAYLSSPGTEQALLFGIGILLWESALINLYPFSFLELDGYNILADLMAMPMLRKQALALIPNLPQRLRNLKTIRRAELIQLGYLTLCLVSVLIYLILHLDAVGAVVSLPWPKFS